MQNKWFWAILGLVLIVGGGWLAAATQTSGGIRIEDVRFKGANGNTMSALVYTPANATAEKPAPGILAVHGYINSRETQDGFAIEFARRGYVVVALDQTGHGYSDPPAFANGFGGPDGLAYLRSLKQVDKNNIGLEGHSMGGWTVLAAAAAMPNDYKSMVLEGSSTGKPFAADGTASWPRNVALVFAQYEEFSTLMWGVDLARDVTKSPKLWALFGTTAAVEPGKVYGDLAQGTARVLYTPAITHPAEHISHEAIGYSLDWFAKTLQGGTPLPSNDQIWLRKEIGTLVALIGFVALLMGAFDVLLGLPMFSGLAVQPSALAAAPATSNGRWWTAFWLTALIPALTYYPAFAVAGALLPWKPYMPQGVTNQIMAWALLNLVITLLLMRFAPKRASRSGIVGASIGIAVVTVAIGYLALWLSDLVFKIDFRFWIVALKLMSAKQWLIFLIYLIPITAFFVAALHVLHRNFSRPETGCVALAVTNALALSAGFIILLVLQYGTLWLTGHLFNPLTAPDLVGFVPLSTIIAIQFVPLLAIVGVLATYTWRRTGSSLPGALICGLFVTWYIVAGTATQAPF
ncbi:MAG: alpha/beta hydrolase family protein [Xanthobacteraceae bacterium]